ncbi:glutathione S-transferase [Methylovirgula sp. 4M-Z18]|uniref:glutathione S-transferase n=1 Tax=Methylovirgula sp. 4M-Z18 TaxID=2293567 RepID=UPI000E2FEE90|nr:glutathione S-transferase [Methylovirgula sp. 4M-Z18]RFB79067.1 glutathione S-transferase [Methylovirgula sp. 4M-Z18]
MLLLRSSPASPFGRKVKIAAALLGLLDRIEVVATDTLDPSDSIRLQNPLGKIPCLLTDDGTALYDSRVIVEYLDSLSSGRKLIPAEPKARFATLTCQALADGIADAALLLVYEKRFRPPEKHETTWTEHQHGKIERGLAALEAAPPTGEIDIGHVAVACVLGYLDLRFAGAWRATHPKLEQWLAEFAQAVPMFEKTRFVPT